VGHIPNRSKWRAQIGCAGPVNSETRFPKKPGSKSVHRVRGYALLVAPAASAAVAPAAAAPVAAAAPAPTAASAVRLGTGFVDDQGPAVAILAVQGGDGRLSFLIAAHFHKAKAFGPTGVPVHDYLSGLHRAVGFEHRLQIAVTDTVGQVPYIQLLAHCGPPKR